MNIALLAWFNQDFSCFRMGVTALDGNPDLSAYSQGWKIIITRFYFSKYRLLLINVQWPNILVLWFFMMSLLMNNFLTISVHAGLVVVWYVDGLAFLFCMCKIKQRQKPSLMHKLKAELSCDFFFYTAGSWFFACYWIYCFVWFDWTVLFLFYNNYLSDSGWHTPSFEAVIPATKMLLND